MKRCAVCNDTYSDDYQVCPRDQTVLRPLRTEIAPGVVLRDKYEVLSELGVGGMATVYKVQHKAFHDFAAVKVVHARLMDHPGFIEHFRNEAIVARQLRHPNAVRIEDFDYTDDGRPFIVMEYVDGQTLDVVRRRDPGPSPLEACLEIAAQTAEALEAAHGFGLIHRQIKPCKIFLSECGKGEFRIKVLGFGTPNVMSLGFNHLPRGTNVGALLYLSPEQLSQPEPTNDFRSDLYGLGMILYELLTGLHAFDGTTGVDRVMQQLKYGAKPVELFGNGVPPEICTLVKKALQIKPEDRFQSAAEMLAALRAVQRLR